MFGRLLRAEDASLETAVLLVLCATGVTAWLNVPVVADEDCDGAEYATTLGAETVLAVEFAIAAMLLWVLFFLAKSDLRFEMAFAGFAGASVRLLRPGGVPDPPFTRFSK